MAPRDEAALPLSQYPCLAVLRRSGAQADRLLRDVLEALTQTEPGTSVAVVPGRDQCFPGLSVRDNLKLAVENGFARAAGIAPLQDDILPHLPLLVPLLDRPAWALSGGERRALGLAMGLVRAAAVTITDEPLTGLSPAMREAVMVPLRRLKAGGGRLVILDDRPEPWIGFADAIALPEAAGACGVVETGDEKLRDALAGEFFASGYMRGARKKS